MFNDEPRSCLENQDDAVFEGDLNEDSCNFFVCVQALCSGLVFRPCVLGSSGVYSFDCLPIFRATTRAIETAHQTMSLIMVDGLGYNALIYFWHPETARYRQIRQAGYLDVAAPQSPQNTDASPTLTPTFHLEKTLGG